MDAIGQRLQIRALLATDRHQIIRAEADIHDRNRSEPEADARTDGKKILLAISLEYLGPAGIGVLTQSIVTRSAQSWRLLDHLDLSGSDHRREAKRDAGEKKLVVADQHTPIAQLELVVALAHI